MKRLFCTLLALILCISLFGCGENEEFSSSENKEETSSLDDFSVVKENGEIEVKIVEKISSNILKTEPVLGLDSRKWGEVVYVICDDTDEWCIGDEISVEYSKIEVPNDKTKPPRFVAEQIYPVIYEEMIAEKPIIYLYSDSDTVCAVKVDINGKLTCTYPEHGDNGWKNFVVKPDGTLVFPDGKTYYALYWEGVQNTIFDFSKGFCVRGEDTAQFLEWALKEQGLNDREANEFIIYWLPLMQENPYNIISFQTNAYTDTAKLEINPNPDSLLRVFMAYYKSNTEVEIEAQEFEGFERKGFTVVEWGGSRVERP
ncbi:MAG: hypothetical protein IJZ04_04690 [Clostridia bacterium]|nr:hypothetical protein [Clostridia bacterium]